MVTRYTFESQYQWASSQTYVFLLKDTTHFFISVSISETVNISYKTDMLQPSYLRSESMEYK